MRDIQNRSVLVTGAASGIGSAIARAFANAGARVALADVDGARLTRCYELLLDEGHVITPVILDVTSATAWDDAVRKTQNHFGPIDILCNNAGAGRAKKSLIELSESDWQFIMGVNIGGMLNGIRRIVPEMLSRGSPAHVVNTASILGHFAIGGMADYVATKFAALAISEALRIELAGTNVGVSVLCPGLVNTRLQESTQAYRKQERNAVFGSIQQSAASVPIGIEATAVGDAVLEAVREGSFYIFTHPEYAEIVERRSAEIIGALKGGRSWGQADDVTFLGAGVLAMSRTIP